MRREAAGGDDEGHGTHTKSLSPLITYPHTHSYTGTHFYKLNQCK